MAARAFAFRLMSAGKLLRLENSARCLTYGRRRESKEHLPSYGKRGSSTAERRVATSSANLKEVRLGRSATAYAAQREFSSLEENRSRTSRFEVRPATPADAVEMAALEQLCGGFWNADELVAECAEEKSILLVAADTLSTENVVGLVLVWCIADEAQVLEVAVHPEMQRQGVGLKLMEHALTTSSRRVKEKAGRGAAVLEVAIDNEPAIALYTKLGFKRVGLRRDYYPDGSDAILMRLPIG